MCVNHTPIPTEMSYSRELPILQGKILKFSEEWGTFPPSDNPGTVTWPTMLNVLLQDDLSITQFEVCVFFAAMRLAVELHTNELSFDPLEGRGTLTLDLSPEDLAIVPNRACSPWLDVAELIRDGAAAFTPINNDVSILYNAYLYLKAIETNLSK